MSLSPFHGIFSSLGNLPDPAAGAATGFDGDDAQQQQATTVPIRSGKAGQGQIAVDIYEQDAYYIIRAPIAGVKLSDLDIEIDGNVVTIRGERKPNEEVNEKQFYLQESYWGEFSRSVTLPCAIDSKKVKATFSKDCILKVIIPKEEKVKIVRINEGG